MSNTSKTPALNLTFNHDANTISKALGISDERYGEIKALLDERDAAGNTTKSRNIEWCINTFENPAELALALYEYDGEEEAQEMAAVMEEMAGGDED